MEWSELKNEATSTKPISDTPLGVVDEAAYGQLDVRLQSGDMVLSFSDAVTESHDVDGRQLGETGVLRLVRELEVQDSEELIPALIERIRSLKDSNLRQDDATFLLGQATGGGPSLKNNLLVPLRFMGRIADRTEIVRDMDRQLT